MIRTGVTIVLAEEMRAGPFVFHGDLEGSCTAAARIGFDAVEILPASPDTINAAGLRYLLAEHNLKLAGMGTGAGFVIHGLHLCSSDPSMRAQAIDFIAGMIDCAGPLGAPVVIGSMQGRIGPDMQREDAMSRLRDALNQLGEKAGQHGVPLILEPLNRYETNVLNRLEQGVELIRSLDTDNVKLLADLFHMNIEEQSICDALRDAGQFIGHVHFVDSNRRPAGFGHTDLSAVGRTLIEIDYQGYVSAEVFPYPDALGAAEQSLVAMRQCVLEQQPGNG